MEQGLRATPYPTIEFLLLFPGVGRLMKIAAVITFYPNHVQAPRFLISLFDFHR